MVAQPFEEAESPWISQGLQEAAQGVGWGDPTRGLASLGLAFSSAPEIVP